MGHKVTITCDGCGADAGDTQNPQDWVNLKLMTVGVRLSEGHILLCVKCKRGPIPEDALAELEAEASQHSRWQGVPEHETPEAFRARTPK